MSESMEMNVEADQKTRLWPAFLIVALGIVLIWVFHVIGVTVFKPILDFYLVIALVNFLLYVWLRAWSKLDLRQQVNCGLVLLAAQLIVLGLTRIDGFDGTGRFIAKWRWTPTPEEILAEFESTLAVTPGAQFTTAGEHDSPSFRGSRRDGTFRLPQSSFDWQRCQLIERWRRPVGRGWSSFAAVGAYCITQEQYGESESVVCYDIDAGHILWRYDSKARFHEYTSGPGPRATPTIVGEKVFAFGATGNLICLRANDGTLVWERRLCARKADQVLFGYSSSPLYWRGLVIVTPGFPNNSIVAVDAESGAIKWSLDNRRAGYSSPQLFHHKNGTSVLVFDAVGLHAYDVDAGKLEWSFPWGDNSLEQVNVCQPAIYDSQHILVSSGYGRGAALLTAKQNQEGDWSVASRWQTGRLKSKFASLVIFGRYVFGLDEGILTCVDVETGERKWKAGRYGHGQIILCNETVLVQCESGEIALVAATPVGHQEIAMFDGLSDRTWNHPVIVRDRLLVRNDREAICFQITDLGAVPTLESD